MKKMLSRVETNPLYHYTRGVLYDGPNMRLRGDCTGLRGDCTWLRGTLDACELSDAERSDGVDIETLVAVSGRM